ncbi:DUF1576 domain-containing protein [Clostridium rectalis]|uniref:DUF1576 domain-containing protein n=1 Tax=Clostridium rectalis TaxID=2040295 RepID=UPI000F638754|nr:DUF1576 domain-containing protein [Clostridium rectalis]
MENKTFLNYFLIIVYFSFFIIFGLCNDSLSNILSGLKTIFLESDILITDYLQIGGIGASFINSGLLCLICIFILIKLKVKPNGSTFAALFTMGGFAFFGKNLLNVWPIFLGTWLYSKYQKEPFLNYILIALFGSTLSPTVNQLSFSGYFSWWQGILLGIIIGTLLGFILPPVASYSIKVHQGYNLYNSGFAAGLIATLTMSIFRLIGIDFEQRFLWSTEYTNILAIFLMTLFTSMLVIGYILNNKSFINLKNLYKQSGRLVSDYYILFGQGCCLINMGILGILFTSYVLIIGGAINGPVMAGIFTIVGFGAFGKHIKNTIPIVLGTILAGFFNIWNINSPGILLSSLFSTTLAPISGQFGYIYGLLAGFLHTCIVMNIGYLHAGLNLYNNGFAGGFVAIILIPIINGLKKEYR